MKPALRIALAVATVSSMVLLAATLSAWALSYRDAPRPDSVVYARPGGAMWWIWTYRGDLCARRLDRWPHDAPVQGIHWSDDGLTLVGGPPITSRWQRFGARGLTGVVAVSFSPSGTRTPFVPSRFTVIPFWMVAITFAALPLARIGARWQRLRAARLRRERNLCATCGYDLRATPQGGRCPECGTDSTPTQPPPIHADSCGVGSAPKSQAP
jgi:hypothetical protein